MGVSKNRGTPKWMVYNGKTSLKTENFGGYGTPIFGNTHMFFFWISSSCRSSSFQRKNSSEAKPFLYLN